ncbi:hypothetical protein ABH15_05100 [Methanoculleus taiwanensis]|uniref:histidine kinase n=1 Tax=Methanoculleus taiwanensis TaxID=1550565 RepID=A0A498GYJ3_9EURY|nr:HAMP domain-containing sensor histidine kinase [Methanoculleus taiwanensis]RXE55632.1 hypothetical protein ABH15_05100 [Methanoculleus taiwanensis]
MTKKSMESREPPSFSWYLLCAIILITLPIVGFISVMDDREVENELVANYLLLQEQTEKSIGQSIHLIDTGRKLYDTSLDRRVEQGFSPFLEEYERSGRNPAAMNLAAVRAELGGDMDLYIINESGVIEYTTYEPDLLLDFRDYPEYYASITALRLGETFSAERTVRESDTGRVWKYAYMPTPDHRYLLELSTTLPENSPYFNELRYTSIVDETLALNPNLLGIRIFNEFGLQATVEREGVSTDHFGALPIVATVLRDKNTVEMIDPENGTLTRFIYIDRSDQEYALAMNGVVEMTYTTAPLADALFQTRMHHLLLALVAIMLTAGVAFPVAKRITRPIRDIADDVDAIAHGDLDHPIRASGGAEFVRLERSITTMVAALKAHIERLRASEQRIHKHSEHLEEQVRERKAELERSNQEANLYLDILIHDVNNANAVTLGYAALLTEMLQGERHAHAEKLLQRLQVSSDIIDRVSTIRKAQEEGVPLKAVDLDRIVRMEITSYPAAAIRYEPRPITVYADELLAEVFANLIGNAVKFGGDAVTVTIRIEEMEETVLISIEDTGPGIADDLKEVLFNRFRKGAEAGSRKGLGLYISRMLVERYGGRIWAEDRVPGRQECGAAVRFTLKKPTGD